MSVELGSAVAKESCLKKKSLKKFENCCMKKLKNKRLIDANTTTTTTGC